MKRDGDSEGGIEQNEARGRGELHEWRRRECRIIGGGRGERELYRMERREWELYRMGEVVGCRLDQAMVT